jgi:DNA-binding NarL/FixJ family response regulator
MDSPAVVAGSLNRFGNWLVNIGRPAAGLTLHHEALEIFRAWEDTAAVAGTFDLLGMAFGIRGNIAECVRHYGQAIEQFQRLNDAAGLSSSLGSRAVYAGPALTEGVPGAGWSPDDVDRDAAESLRLARRTGSLAAQAYAEWTAGAARAAFGNLGGALSSSREAVRIAAEIEHQQWLSAGRFSLGCSYLATLEPDLAIAQFEMGLPLARQLGTSWWVGNITASLAAAHLEKGDPGRARKALEAAFSEDAVPTSLPEYRMARAFGELLLAEDRPEQALRIADRLLAEAGPAPVPHLLRLRGNAMLALDRQPDGIACLNAALDAATEARALPLVLRIQHDLAVAYMRDGAAAPAARALARAGATAEAIAVTLPDPSARERYLERSRDASPPGKPGAGRRPPARHPGGLTAREREIAGLIGAGKSNAAIAGELFLSERTVESHVSGILAKLDYSSRAQIAVWAVQHGLVSPA